MGQTRFLSARLKVVQLVVRIGDYALKIAKLTIFPRAFP
jgi:hypothetical protein